MSATLRIQSSRRWATKKWKGSWCAVTCATFSLVGPKCSHMMVTSTPGANLVFSKTFGAVGAASFRLWKRLTNSRNGLQTFHGKPCFFPHVSTEAPLDCFGSTRRLWRKLGHRKDSLDTGGCSLSLAPETAWKHHTKGQARTHPSLQT